MDKDSGSKTLHSQLKASLRNASQQQRKRNLSSSCRFINELLIGMVPTTVPGNKMNDINDIHEDEVDMVLFASNLMDMGDYLRCAYYLRKIHKTNGVFQMKSSIGMFLGSYSLFLAGEKSKEQDSCEYIKRSENSKNNSKMSANKSKVNKETESASYYDHMFHTTEYSSRNPYLVDIYKELLPLYINYRSKVNDEISGMCAMDGYLMFLFAIIVRNIRCYGGGASGMPSELVDSNSGSVHIPSTRDLLIEAIRLCPWNWSSWLELIEEYCSVNNNRIPTWNDIMGTYSNDNNSSQVMYYMFLIQLYLELQQGEMALHILQSSGILQVFPTSQILLNSTALSHYCIRDYDRAQEIFEMARDMDPHRLDHVDTYSNILYVKERRAELSHLAHAVTKADKFIPESNCVVGNYYSLKGQHERAILYFQRALKLNNQCISAWTLMGHEYVELRNTASAVQCYRKAVEVSTRDYRAWYGLGQTYEMLHMYQYALYYYKKAAALKPSDARMWCAVGNCFSRLGSKKDAMLTLEKAVHCGDREGIATRELARLYRENGNTTKAAECYHKHLNTLGLNQMNSNIDQEKAEGIMFLANYHRNKSDLTHAEEFCNYLVDYIGPEGDEARAMQREIRSYFQANNGGLHTLNHSNTSFNSDRGGILPDSDDER